MPCAVNEDVGTHGDLLPRRTALDDARQLVVAWWPRRVGRVMIAGRDTSVKFAGALVVLGAVLATPSAGSAQSQRSALDRTVPLHAPDESTIPRSPVGGAVKYGKQVLTETQTYAKAYVGNGLNCSSCHLDAGRR